MPVIKQANSKTAARQAIVLDLGDLSRQGEAIIARAREEAARVVAAAEARAAQLIATADERGFAEGHRRGLAAGRAEGETAGRSETVATLTERGEALAAAWSDALAAWEEQREEMLRGAREDVLALALALARHIVLRVPAVDPTVVQDQLAAALDLVNAPSALAVRAHPEDRALLAKIMPSLLERLDACGHAELEDDASVARGGCIVRAGRGQVDATLHAQLQRIVTMLLPARAAEIAGEDGDGGTAP